MPINIDHSKSGTVTLQTSNVTGTSTFVFPNINGESTIFVSGSPISYVSGLQACLNTIDNYVPFNASVSSGLWQRTSQQNGNCSTASYSIVFGVNGCASVANSIVQAVESSGNCLGWNQNVQNIFKTTTNTNATTSFLTEISSASFGEGISYLNGKVVAKGGSEFATYDFCTTITKVGGTLSLASKTINTGAYQGGNYAFDIYFDEIVEYVNFRVSGINAPLNWLMCLNQLKLRTN